jgi:hypothetical protein
MTLQIQLDGVSIEISEARPMLALKESRSVQWEGGVRLVPDRIPHRLDLVLDATDLAGLLPITEIWETQAEVSHQHLFVFR